MVPGGDNIFVDIVDLGEPTPETDEELELVESEDFGDLTSFGDAVKWDGIDRSIIVTRDEDEAGSGNILINVADLVDQAAEQHSDIDGALDFFVDDLDWRDLEIVTIMPRYAGEEAPAPTGYMEIPKEDQSGLHHPWVYEPSYEPSTVTEYDLWHLPETHTITAPPQLPSDDWTVIIQTPPSPTEWTHSPVVNKHIWPGNHKHASKGDGSGTELEKRGVASFPPKHPITDLQPSYTSPPPGNNKPWTYSRRTDAPYEHTDTQISYRFQSQFYYKLVSTWMGLPMISSTHRNMMVKIATEGGETYTVTAPDTVSKVKIAPTDTLQNMVATWPGGRLVFPAEATKKTITLKAVTWFNEEPPEETHAPQSQPELEVLTKTVVVTVTMEAEATEATEASDADSSESGARTTVNA